MVPGGAWAISSLMVSAANTRDTSASRLEPEEIPAAVRLITGQVFAEWDERALNVSWQTVGEVVDGLVAATPADREAIYAQAVDGGQAIQLLLERARRLPPDPPPLTLPEVYQTLEQIAAVSGSGSRARKESLLRGILQHAEPIEAKVIVKNVLGEMRHGAGEGIMIEAIEFRLNGEPVKIDVDGERMLLWVLRHDLGLTGSGQPSRENSMTSSQTPIGCPA